MNRALYTYDWLHGSAGSAVVVLAKAAVRIRKMHALHMTTQETHPPPPPPARARLRPRPYVTKRKS